MKKKKEKKEEKKHEKERESEREKKKKKKKKAGEKEEFILTVLVDKNVLIILAPYTQLLITTVEFKDEMSQLSMAIYTQHF